MTYRLRRYGRNRNQLQTSNMADVWANSMVYHPRATCHIAGCWHLVNSLSWFHSHMPHCRVEEFHPPYWKLFLNIVYFIFVFNAVWMLTNGGFRIVSETLVIISFKSIPACDRQTDRQTLRPEHTIYKILLCASLFFKTTLSLTHYRVLSPFIKCSMYMVFGCQVILLNEDVRLQFQIFKFHSPLHSEL